jgi:hypothetical protein
MMHPVPRVLQVICFLACAIPQPLHAQVTVEETDEGIRFAEDDRPILWYRHRPVSLDGAFTRSHYVHPLYDLDGNVITEDFPEDHPHQRGIFWAWHQVKVGDLAAGDSWLTQDFTWDVVKTGTTVGANGEANLSVEVVWSSPTITDNSGEPAQLVREATSIKVHAVEQTVRRIDFEIRLLALVDQMSIGGSDDEKGYGGFSARFRLPDDVRFQSTHGEFTPENIPCDAGPWVDLFGSYGKSPSKSGMALLCHPTSAGYPQKWILRSHDSMQNAVYPGRDCIPLSGDRPLILRYRLVLHRDAVDRAQVDQWHAQYAQENFSQTQPPEPK